MLKQLVTWLVQTIGSLGYLGIIALMFLESSFFPFPSEVVIIPAGYLASKGEMALWLVILAGIIGSVLGAIFNYYIALWIGRPGILKFGKYFLITEERYKKVEDFFKRHGEITTFVGRLIPGVRQYISFPAGLARMNLLRFVAFTGLGAGIWVCVLALIGYTVGANEALVRLYWKRCLVVLLLACAVVVLVYAIIHRRNQKT
ncbi:DedA family protein [Candidatus Woesearchaeota archaeon]|nr:DedA family protein [Candidatus Woesearchaeota archaeon]RLE41459.1 MAG: DedA family protein [Candidatus Woesearchaeota archaeon]